VTAHALEPHRPASVGPAVPFRLPLVDSDMVFGAALGLVLAWVAVRANGGLRVSDTTTVEIVVDLLAGAVAAIAIMAVPGLRHRAPGAIALGFFALFAVASVLSTMWSITPDQSWLENNRVVTYLAVFASGMALVRLAPHRWTVIIAGITVASLALSAYALLHKVFPAHYAPDEIYARLREPFGYWNAVGLMAAMGIPGCLWLGARRAGHGAVNSLAYPAVGLLVVVLLLSYSRGALLALVVGCAFWFATTPLRLRAFAVLATGSLGGVLVILWAFSQDALAKDRVPLAQRVGAGHELGLAVLLMLVALLAAGLLINFISAGHVISTERRRRAGRVILACLAAVPIVFAVGLATTERGFFGSITHGWSQLTDPKAATPSNQPGRLTSVGSVRARYWNEALKIFEDHPVAGVGVGGYAVARLRYRNDDLDVQHAHGYVVQVLADRGLIGLGLSLAALAAVGVALLQATGLRRKAPDGMPTSPERVGLLTLATLVIVFGVHSFVDWTWFIPGVTIPALLAGGWLAGRGPLELPERSSTRIVGRIRANLRASNRVVAAVAVLLIAASAAWAAWQPKRSLDAGDAAIAAATDGKLDQARGLATRSQNLDPLSVEPYFVRAGIEVLAGDQKAALRSFQRAVRLQPGNPTTWTQLALHQLRQLKDPAAAKRTLDAALYLDPRSTTALALLVEANRGVVAQIQAQQAAEAAKKAGGG
jgi:tetratricopeptide (TPR) repeat protein